MLDALAQVVEVGRRGRPVVGADVVEHALREGAQAGGGLEARGRLDDGIGLDPGRRETGDVVRRRRVLEGGADEVGIPAGDLRQPRERDARLLGLMEGEGDELHGARDGLGGDVLAGRRTAELTERRHDLAVTGRGVGQLPLGLPIVVRGRLEVPRWCGLHGRATFPSASRS